MPLSLSLAPSSSARASFANAMFDFDHGTAAAPRRMQLLKVEDTWFRNPPCEGAASLQTPSRKNEKCARGQHRIYPKFERHYLVNGERKYHAYFGPRLSHLLMLLLELYNFLLN